MFSLVYHRKPDGKSFPSGFTLVAVVRSTKIEEVFELTNSVDSSWTDNRKVRTIKFSRSTTTGDVIVTPNGAFRLTDEGWKRFIFNGVAKIRAILDQSSFRILSKALLPGHL
jgi:hypothetical protein